MKLQHNTVLTTLAMFFVIGSATQATAQTSATASSRYTLLDSTTAQAQPNTPYFLFFRGDGIQTTPLMTDAQGRTQPINAKDQSTSGAHLSKILNMTYQTGALNRDFNDPNNQNILVKAEGQGSQIFMMSLNGLVDGNSMNGIPTNVMNGTPYVIWNKATSQAVCGQTNKQGYSHAYFVDDSKSWYDNSHAFLLRSNQPCDTVAQSITQWLSSSEPTLQMHGEQFVKTNFNLTPAQYSQAFESLSYR